jgi:glycosyltransferase involved in cell wall biosynthesis
MAHGLPVIVSKNLPIRDFVKDGVNGLTIDPYDPRDLAKKLAFLIHHDDVREAMGDASLRIMHKVYNPDIVGQMIIKLYQATLSRESSKK